MIPMLLLRSTGLRCEFRGSLALDATHVGPGQVGGDRTGAGMGPRPLERIGRESEITVLFSDIRDFTRYSEEHSPREVVQLLNAYFTAVVPVIEGEKGTIAQYNGDGVMVVFGAPRHDADHAERGVRSALAMVRRVHQLADRWRALGAPHFRIGVGVHTGPAIVGARRQPAQIGLYGSWRYGEHRGAHRVGE